MLRTAAARVLLVNPNFVRPPVSPYALDILCSHLEAAGFETDVIDLGMQPDLRALDRYFERRQPLLIGVTLRNAGSAQPQEQRVFLPDHLEVIEALRARSAAPIVIGGAGFSSMPFAALEYFRVPFGVKGPGEYVLCELAAALAAGRSPESIAGLLLWDERGARAAHPDAEQSRKRLPAHEPARYRRRSGVADRVDNRLYYERGGLGNVLTKNGCVFACNHCVEPDAKGTSMALRGPEAIVDEIEALVAQGVYDIHTTDSEFNIKPAHGKMLLREIIRRRRAGGVLRELRLWIYAHPVPFDEELAELLAEAGCKGASLSAEHMARESLAVWQAPGGGARLAYTLDDVRRVVSWLVERGMQVTTELLLGLPGENLETLRGAIDASLALPATVIGYTLGLQVFPYAPLGIRLAAESNGTRAVPGVQSNTARAPILLTPLARCASRAQYERQFWFDDEGRVRPVHYFSPDLPEKPETIARPDGRWTETVRWMHEYIPKSEHYRLALPTDSGSGGNDNNYADNPFLQAAIALGYRGAYYSWWRGREQIVAEAVARGVMPAPGSERRRAAG